jgi:hypothetical protein
LTLARPLLAALAALALVAPAALADSNPNTYDCRGHVEAGAPQPGDDDQQVLYKFACSGPITGYQLQPQIGDTGFDTSTSVFDTHGNAITTDSFTCQGDFPGWGVNCTGKYSGSYGIVTGQFAIATKLCAEPRVDPLLTVVYATADSRGVVTQNISGPYDLGRPHGCPKSAQNGRTRIPAGGVTTIGADAKTTKSKKTATSKKAKKARRASARVRAGSRG